MTVIKTDLNLRPTYHLGCITENNFKLKKTGKLRKLKYFYFGKNILPTNKQIFMCKGSHKSARQFIWAFSENHFFAFKVIISLLIATFFMSSFLLVRVASSRFINSSSLNGCYPPSIPKQPTISILKSRQGAALVFFARQQISDVYMDEETCPPRETDRQPIDLVTTEEKNPVFKKHCLLYFVTKQVT